MFSTFRADFAMEFSTGCRMFASDHSNLGLHLPESVGLVADHRHINLGDSTWAHRTALTTLQTYLTNDTNLNCIQNDFVR